MHVSLTYLFFLEGLPTITSILEGFGGVPSYNTPPQKKNNPFATNFCLYHHKSLQYKSDTMNNAWDIAIQSYGVTCVITLIFVHFRAFIEY